MARADYVVLVAGDIITGKVIRKTKDEVAIRLTIGGLMTFKLEQVVKIRRGDVTLGNGEQGPLPKECDLSAVADESEPQRRQPPAGSGPTPGPSPPPPPAPLGSAAKPSANTEPAPPAGPQAFDPAGGPFPGPLPAPKLDPENLITDGERLYAVAPPVGFVRWEEGKAPSILLAMKDPFTQASFTVTSYVSPDTVETLKNLAIQTYKNEFARFAVLRDMKLTSASLPDAWLVETESRYGKELTRQLQVFTKRGNDVFLLTYTCSADGFTKNRTSYEKSIETFRFVELPKTAE
jgi:hypothetical protein